MKFWSECSVDEQIERWENVERVLKKLTPHERRRHWNMANWGVRTECGTVCCAAGHCGRDRWFRNRGLKLKPYVVPKGENYVDYDSGGFGGFENGVSPSEFFGYDGCNNIFYVDRKRPVSEVIREVRAYIKELKSPQRTSDNQE